MASLNYDERHRRYRVRFTVAGVSYNRSLGKITSDRPEQAKAEAEATLARVEKTLGLIAEGIITLDDVADPGRFIVTGGRDTGRSKAPTVRTLQNLIDAAKSHTPDGAKEARTHETDELHRSHLLRLIGGSTPLRSLTPSVVQAYIVARSAEAYRGGAISTQTIRKEVGRLRADWNRALDLKLLGGLGPPIKGLLYEKDAAKPPFRTWEDIQATLDRGGLSDGERAELWETLFLRVKEVEEVLEFVRAKANYPFVHPMFALVAYTGARRSEMIRSRVEDIDFVNWSSPRIVDSF